MMGRHWLTVFVWLGAVLAGCSNGPLTSIELAPAKQAPLLPPPDTLTPLKANDPEIKGRRAVESDGSLPYNVIADNPELAEKLRLQSVAVGAMAGAMVGSIAGLAIGGNKTRSADPSQVVGTKEALFDVVRLLWGTDRKVDVKSVPAPVMGPAGSAPVTSLLASTASAQAVATYPKLGAERGDKLSMGYGVITIPKAARRVGTIARPKEYTFLDVTLYRRSEDPAKHFTIASLRQLEASEIGAWSNAALDTSVRFKDQALVFVHGYNSSFEDALYRTAQIAHDLEFDGLTAMYSWPSRGSLADYPYDLDSAVRSQRFFIEFLGEVAKRTRAKRIHIVAHSMGNRPLLDALRALDQGKDTTAKDKIGQIIFAAPDVDRDLFAEIVGRLRLGTGRTLYASNEDKALILSRQPSGVPRAGDVPKDGPLVLTGLDTIDISDASTKALLALNHSDYAERSHILADLRLLLQKGTRPPDARFAVYQVVQGRDGPYWKYAANR